MRGECIGVARHFLGPAFQPPHIARWNKSTTSFHPCSTRLERYTRQVTRKNRQLPVEQRPLDEFTGSHTLDNKRSTERRLKPSELALDPGRPRHTGGRHLRHRRWSSGSVRGERLCFILPAAEFTVVLPRPRQFQPNEPTKASGLTWCTRPWHTRPRRDRSGHQLGLTEQRSDGDDDTAGRGKAAARPMRWSLRAARPGRARSQKPAVAAARRRVRLWPSCRAARYWSDSPT